MTVSPLIPPLKVSSLLARMKPRAPPLRRFAPRPIEPHSSAACVHFDEDDLARSDRLLVVGERPAGDLVRFRGGDNRAFQVLRTGPVVQDRPGDAELLRRSVDADLCTVEMLCPSTELATEMALVALAGEPAMSVRSPPLPAEGNHDHARLDSGVRRDGIGFLGRAEVGS